MESKTIDYYDKVADKYISSTIDVDFTERQNEFMNLLSEGSTILDLGCGSGRDSKAFLNHGFQVIALDGSVEMVKSASNYTGLEVIHSTFEEYDFSHKVDGVWACSSLLHVSSINLANILGHIYTTLNSQGFIYLSFKYGNFEGFRRGRMFNDMNESKFEELLKFDDLYRKYDIVSEKITADVRVGRSNEKWLNIIMRKV